VFNLLIFYVDIGTDNMLHSLLGPASVVHKSSQLAGVIKFQKPKVVIFDFKAIFHFQGIRFGAVAFPS